MYPSSILPQQNVDMQVSIQIHLDPDISKARAAPVSEVFTDRSKLGAGNRRKALDVCTMIVLSGVKAVEECS